MRWLLLICVTVICACSRTPQEARLPLPTNPCIFDEALKSPEYANAIAEAQRELLTDEWETKPFHVNASQGRRVAAVGDRILAQVKPRFSGMNISNLVLSAKLVPCPYGDIVNDYGAVADYVYSVGNREIIKEIKSRPPEELRALRHLGTDQVRFYEGPQGFDDSLKWQLAEILEDLGLTNGLSR